MTLIKTPELIKEPIRALWWKQPYGTLMLHGKIETRIWHSRYQGLVLICTSQTPYDLQTVLGISGQYMHSVLSSIYGKDWKATVLNNRFRDMQNGQAIAVGRLVESRPMLQRDAPFAYVEHGIGLYSHVYSDVTPIKPFPLKGKQGWKTLTPEIWEQIEFIQ